MRFYNLFISITILLAFTLPQSAFAQTKKLALDAEETKTTTEEPKTDEQQPLLDAENIYYDALKQKNEGNFEKALSLLELAYAKFPANLYLYERALVLEQMHEYKLALQVLDENKEALSKDQSITDFSLTRERISQKMNDPKSQEIASPEESTDVQETHLLGPVLTGTGAVMMATGIALLFVANGKAQDLNCTTQAENPTCENPTKSITRQEWDDEQSSINTLRPLGWISTLGGAALAGTGVFLWKF